jgi:hypothetical protein
MKLTALAAFNQSIGLNQPKLWTIIDPSVKYTENHFVLYNFFLYVENRMLDRESGKKTDYKFKRT